LHADFATVRSDIHLTEDSEAWEVSRYVIAFKEVSLVRLMMAKERRGMCFRSTSSMIFGYFLNCDTSIFPNKARTDCKMTPGTKKSGAWIELIRDDFREYEELWKHASGEDEKRKRTTLDQVSKF
jgi:hypothetical protein